MQVLAMCPQRVQQLQLARGKWYFFAQGALGEDCLADRRRDRRARPVTHAIHVFLETLAVVSWELPTPQAEVTATHGVTNMGQVA